MKITDAQIKKLSLRIYKKLEEKQLIEIHVSTDVILKKIESVLLFDAKSEDDIEKEAKAILDKFKAQIQSGQIDAHEMYLKIKNQLMKDKKFIK